jgi:hypothetical protein
MGAQLVLQQLAAEPIRAWRLQEHLAQVSPEPEQRLASELPASLQLELVKEA